VCARLAASFCVARALGRRARASRDAPAPSAPFVTAAARGAERADAGGAARRQRGMTTTFETMKRIIVKDYELAPERLVPDTPLADIELDSLAITELIFALEDEFNV